MKNTNPSKVLIAFIIFLIPVFLLLGSALFLGKALIPADILLKYPVWQQDYSQVTVQNSLLSDQIVLFYPWHVFARAEFLQTGRMPLWNPYEFTGQPLVGNAQSTLFYPPNLLLFLLDAGRVAGLRGAFNLLIAGLFAYLFCRELGVSHTGSLLSGLSFMLSGPIIVWLGHTPGNVLAVLPLEMWAAEKLIKNRGRFPWWVVLGLGMAVSVFAGHPETTFHTNFAVGVYLLVRAIGLQQPWKAKRSICLNACLAVLFGVLLSAVQLIPFVELLLHSSTLASGGRGAAGANWLYSDIWVYNFSTILTLLLPQFFGTPVLNNYIWPFPNYQNYCEQSLYIGLIPLAFAIYACFHPRGKKWVMLFSACGLLSLAVAWRLPLFEVVNHLPVFSLVSNKRMIMLFTFFFSMIAGFGFDTWQAAGEQGKKRLVEILPITIPLLAAVALVGFIFFVGKVDGPLQSRGVLLPNFLRQASAQVFNLNHPSTYFPALVAVLSLLLIALAWWKRVAVEKVKIGLLACAMAELVVLAWNFNPAIDPALVFPQTPVLQRLRSEREPYRVTGKGTVFPENAGTVYQIPQIEGYDLPVYAPTSQIYYAQGGLGSDYHQKWSADWPLVDFLNIKYVFSDQALSQSKYKLVEQTSNYWLYENTQVLPRAYLVHDYVVIPDDAAALKTITSGSFDFRSQAVLSQELPAAFKLQKNNSTSPETGQVTFSDYAADQANLAVETGSAALLVMSDVNYPGWKAFVDGAETPILQANYAYRAVFVPAGAHRVIFSYQPASFRLGLWLSIAGLALAVGGILFAWLRKK